ncbi:MAG: LysE family translocator [Chloroflexota bacterium]|nr:LysE family translocator [Chloroflexota bacterium]
MDSTMLAFLGTSLLLIVTPGPDTATTIRNALRYGRRGALLTPLGTGSAILVHATVAALGLSTLLRTAAGLYTVVRLCGAAYLIFLGIQALRSARQSNDSHHGPAETKKAAIALRGSSYWQGFLSAILNPKLVVFFATFLPQFIVPGHAVLPRMLFLGIVFDSMVVIWLMGYGLFVTIMHRFFNAPAVRRRMERLTGVVLIALGARIALEKS